MITPTLDYPSESPKLFACGRWYFIEEIVSIILINRINIQHKFEILLINGLINKFDLYSLQYELGVTSKEYQQALNTFHDNSKLGLVEGELQTLHYAILDNIRELILILLETNNITYIGVINIMCILKIPITSIEKDAIQNHLMKRYARGELKKNALIENLMSIGIILDEEERENFEISERIHEKNKIEH
jgi:hypothetical protein